MEWLTKYWKTLSAIVYLLICILDFLIIPSYIIQQTHRQLGYEYYKTINQIFKDNPEAIRIILSRSKPAEWTPFSSRTGGIVHIAFGAILTGTIIGKRKKE